MSALHDKCHIFVAKWEGGLTDNPNDSGGITKYGVSLKFLRDFAKTSSKANNLGSIGVRVPISANTIRLLTKDQAKQILKWEFWDSLKLDEGIYAPYALLFYDCAVNCGPSTSVKIQQSGYNAFAGAPLLAIDGKLGPRTPQALAQAGQTVDASRLPQLLDCCIAARLRHYSELVGKYPKNKTFLAGWQNRTNDMKKYILETDWNAGD